MHHYFEKSEIEVEHLQHADRNKNDKTDKTTVTKTSDALLVLFETDLVILLVN